MKTKQLNWTSDKGWVDQNSDSLSNPQLVFLFGSTDQLYAMDPAPLKEKFGSATIVGCTTAGEIYVDDVYDDTITATAVEFSNTPVEVHAAKVADGDSGSFDAGKEIGDKLKKDGLKGIILISDGLSVNGSNLVEGVRSVVGNEITVTGGLAGDGGRFEKTGVWYDGSCDGKRVVGIALYGDKIEIGHGSYGGWEEFGPLREVTKSEGNVVYEIDGTPALELYKKYLGQEHIDGLPGSALLFPISVYPKGQQQEQVVRTVLAVDEETQSMTFAGDVPVGWAAQLMRANFDELVDAAKKAGESATSDGNDSHKLALLISCVGRKMILGQRSTDEVESVVEGIGGDLAVTGFYSYGEISPYTEVDDSCALHNQTMTVTVLSEKD